MSGEAIGSYVKHTVKLMKIIKTQSVPHEHSTTTYSHRKPGRNRKWNSRDTPPHQLNTSIHYALAISQDNSLNDPTHPAWNLPFIDWLPRISIHALMFWRRGALVGDLCAQGAISIRSGEQRAKDSFRLRLRRCWDRWRGSRASCFLRERAFLRGVMSKLRRPLSLPISLAHSKCLPFSSVLFLPLLPTKILSK